MIPRRTFLGTLASVAAAASCRRTPTGAAPAGAPDASSPPPKPSSKPPGFDPDDPAFAADPESFVPKRRARPGEWLDRFPETGTTFEEYIRSSPVGRTAKRTKLVLQPLGSFDERSRALLDKLREYTAVFFDCPAVIAPDMALPAKGRR